MSLSPFHKVFRFNIIVMFKLNPKSCLAFCKKPLHAVLTISFVKIVRDLLILKYFLFNILALNSADKPRYHEYGR